jgi:2-enoate reductase
LKDTLSLFEPGRIGKLTVKNRIVMAPIGAPGFTDPDGSLSQAGINYFEARASGGTGLIVTGTTMVGRKPNAPRVFQIHTCGFEPGNNWMEKLAKTVHKYDAKIAVQISCGVGRVGAPQKQPGGPGIPQMALVGPSAVPNFWDHSFIQRELTVGEIEGLIEGVELSATAIRDAGIDAINIHGHSGYLIDMFMTELWNQRTDKYGGSLEGRLRFPLDIIAAIKRGAGPDFPIIFRFGITHAFPGGRQINEGLEIARRLEAAGVDALDVDVGSYETHYLVHPSTYSPSGSLVYVAEMTKKAVKIPVMAVGKLQDPTMAESVIKDEKADFIILAKQLIADPEWPNKVKEGKWQDIRPCIGDLECLRAVREGRPSTCTVNPLFGREKTNILQGSQRKKKVLVVGGGPGGLEAAQIAALRGHDVTLFEKNKVLGGNLIPAGIPAFKQEYDKLIKYYSRKLKHLSVKIEMGKEASPELVKKFKPDVLFVATGANSIVPEIPGVHKSHVITATELLLTKKKPGTNVVVIGGGNLGGEVALYLAQKGARVTIIARHDFLSDMFWALRVHLQKLLADAHVDILTFTQVSEITDTGIDIIDKDSAHRVLPADMVVLAIGLMPDKVLVDSLKLCAPEVYPIGDCVDAREVKSAISEAFNAAIEI